MNPGHGAGHTQQAPSVCSHHAVADMGSLAQEVLGCQAKLLSGGLGSPNRDLVLRHLVTGHPLLIPYPRALEGGGQGW